MKSYVVLEVFMADFVSRPSSIPMMTFFHGLQSSSPMVVHFLGGGALFVQ